MSDFEVSIRRAADYLNRHSFKPHIKGDRNLYGLKESSSQTEIDSNISFKTLPGIIWRFVGFDSDGLAHFANSEGECTFIGSAYDSNIVRMQVCPPETLEPALVEYLLDLYKYEEYQMNSRDAGEETAPWPGPSAEIALMLEQVGFTEQQLLNVFEIDPDMDCSGSVGGLSIGFNLEAL